MPVFFTSLSRCSTFFVSRKPLISPTLFALTPSTTTACAHTGTVFVDALAPAFVVPSFLDAFAFDLYLFFSPHRHGFLGVEIGTFSVESVD